MSLSTHIITATAIVFFLAAPHLEAQQSDPQRDAEIAAFYQSGLPAELVQELNSIQAGRDQANAGVASYRAQADALRARGRNYNSNCANQRLTQSQAASCRSTRQSLDQESSSLGQFGAQVSQNVQSVISRYENFKATANAWLTQRAVAASASPDDQQAVGSSGPLAYQQGLADATQCFSSNTAGFCSRFSGDEYAACDAGYRQGFADGDQIRDAALQRAWQIGNDDAKAGQENASFDHPDAGGTCRIQWTQHYNRGHFQGRSP